MGAAGVVGAGAGVVARVVRVVRVVRVGAGVDAVDREVGVTAGATSFPRTGWRG